jgi:hypothetical protein
MNVGAVMCMCAQSTDSARTLCLNVGACALQKQMNVY